MSIEIPGVTSVVIPNTITVHLGVPNSGSENVTVSFIDYIKNVASSELYPTWPENALRANIYAIISVTLNRLFTEWYRSRGYNFDITNTTQYDQAFVYNRGTFDTINVLVDDVFNTYISRQGNLEPLYAQFCDGRRVFCDGLSQWGSVDLANQGYTPYEILQYYYGDNINLNFNTPLADPYETYPGFPLQLGDNNPYVIIPQISLNTIARNYPAIPTVQPVDGEFDETTEEAVKEFQRIFKLPVTGIVDKGTWYKIRSIFTAVTKLAELTSRGILLSRIPEYFPPAEEDIVPRVQTVQYFLNVLSAYYDTVPAVDINGVLNTQTRDGIMQFQRTIGLPVTGVIDEETWNTMYQSVLGILDSLPPTAIALPRLIWPGEVYSLGSSGPDVYILQQYLSFIVSVLEGLPPTLPDGRYGPITQASVEAFQQYFGIDVTGVVDEYTWDRIVYIYYILRFGYLSETEQIIDTNIY